MIGKSLKIKYIQILISSFTRGSITQFTSYNPKTYRNKKVFQKRSKYKQNSILNKGKVLAYNLGDFYVV